MICDNIFLKQENKFFHIVKNHLIKRFNPGFPRSLLRGVERCGRFYTRLLRKFVPTAFTTFRSGGNLSVVTNQKYIFFFHEAI